MDEKEKSIYHYRTDSFYNIKKLASDLGAINLGKVKISETKIWKSYSSVPGSLFYEVSFSESEFFEAIILKKI